MPDDIEALRNLGAHQPGVSMQRMVVDGVQENGTLNLKVSEDSEEILTGIAADRSYSPRRAGDIVPVWKTEAGLRAGSPTGAPVSVGSVATTVTRWGQSAPSGSGWQQASQIWVRDGEVYAQTSGTPTAPPSAPANSPKSTITPAARSLYQKGHRTTAWNGGNPAQGGYGRNPNNIGLWSFAAKVTDANTARAIQSLSLQLTRRASGGNPRGVKPHLYLVAAGTPPNSTPTLTDGWVPSNALGWGEAGDFTIPPDRVAKLKSGAARAIACSAANGNAGYILYTAGSGVLTATFD